MLKRRSESQCRLTIKICTNTTLEWFHLTKFWVRIIHWPLSWPLNVLLCMQEIPLIRLAILKLYRKEQFLIGRCLLVTMNFGRLYCYQVIIIIMIIIPKRSAVQGWEIYTVSVQRPQQHNTNLHTDRKKRMGKTLQEKKGSSSLGQ